MRRILHQGLGWLSMWVLICALICLSGCSLFVGQRTEFQEPRPAAMTSTSPEAPPSVTPPPTATATATATLTPSPTPTPEPVTLSLSDGFPEGLAELVQEQVDSLAPVEIQGQMRPIRLATEGTQADAWLGIETLAEARDEGGGAPAVILSERYHAVVAPFATLRDDISLDELQTLWRSGGEGLLLADSTALELGWLWGPTAIEPVLDQELSGQLEATPGALGLMQFSLLDPTLKVLTVDSVNVLSNTLDPSQYSLGLAITLRGPLAEALAPQLAPLWADTTNRDPAKLSQLIMTGVTAMCRLTAERMERYGVLYPALVISDTLRAADITHVSNEVPFIQGCVPDIRSNNLVFCSDYDYWEALEAIGADIVGLSGNHVNDFGYDGARESLAFYRERDIPIYGGGLNIDEACAPIRLEDHGNSFAFIATLAFQPASAWATESLPGACYFYDQKERLIETIRGLKAEGVDVVSIELQYLETYNPFPTDQQVVEFRELRDAGADIVTGVQSHVPQAWEPYGRENERDPGIIVYGLGNLFFDQMWSWQTRTELIARHTIYEGRLISSEVLTAVLEDAAQPRWATPEERAEILQRIYDAAPPRPAASQP
jgi:hypothetical protein